MRKAATVIAVAIALAAAYLLAWPVPVKPVAWTPPADEGFTGAFSENDLLTAARGIDLGDYAGPEDAALGQDGFIYATTANGAILKISPKRGVVDAFAQVGGRPLGIEIANDGSLLVANAHLGVQRVSPTGVVSSVLTAVDGQPLVYADDIAVAKDGSIYLTEASAKFAAADYGGTLESSLLDILEHGGNGLVIEYKPESRKARVIMKGLNFANGIAISDSQEYLLVAETGSYRILKYWLRGPDAGQTEVLIDNLPGFPDNINNGLNGRFWIGLVSPRNEFLDKYSDRTLIRKLVQRLPAFLRPSPVRASHVFAVNGEGQVLMYLHDPAASYPFLTGALETRETLYFTALQGNHLPWLDKQDLLR